MGFASVLALTIAIVHPTLGLMLLTAIGCWFMWELG